MSIPAVLQACLSPCVLPPSHPRLIAIGPNTIHVRAVSEATSMGGSFENRLRFPREVIAAMRAQLGAEAIALGMAQWRRPAARRTDHR